MSTMITQLEVEDTASQFSEPTRRLTDSEVASHTTVSAIPDGGKQAWTVVFSSALLTFWLNGLGNSWGVIQAALLSQNSSSSSHSHSHAEFSTSTLSFVGSLSISCCVLLALLSVRLMRFAGARVTAALGIVFLAAGEFFSGFTTGNVGGLFGTTGVLVGTGSSLCFMVSSVLPAQYFSGRLGLANGIVKAAGGLGGTVLSLGLNALINRVGIPWTFRTVGLLILATGLPAAYLVRELNPARRAPFVDPAVFRNPSFSLIFLAGAIGTFALFVPPFFLPLFARSIGLSASTGAGIVAGFNLCTAVGRFVSGLLCDKMGPVNTFGFAMLLNGLSMVAIWPVSSNLPPLVVFAVINGIANGAFFTAIPTVVTSMYPARAGVVMGMTITGWSAGYFMGAPIAGFLLQAEGGGGGGGGKQQGSIDPYRPAIFYAGGVALVAAGFVLIARLRMERRWIKKV